MTAFSIKMTAHLRVLATRYVLPIPSAPYYRILRHHIRNLLEQV